MAKIEPEKLAFYLVVREPFLTYQRGDHIVPPDEVRVVLENGYAQHVVKVAA